MNNILTMVCFFILLLILALPLGLIVTQFIADAARQRRQKMALTDDSTRASYAFFF